ncbi:type I-E CRISPR-associated protein Cse1/CasA [Deinococcus soli (ex Cha et al. 2016)]|uniref:CRISPR system Cascade subunit CasA n=2 Tax=Deinococcus soli (ex Cha et al. 2016) TaxID=1309411 RepID=A0AAE3XHU9_9DEIO|nr:type I-E CRISPR-associated protein Cse1/CasA [Deinococcus soli (ex Cha et al. 2016)]MDR6221174.1 CRISPR system Cascade subunit CasA [Deinococcus soli (ex Cha et al. 2016)]MDR6331107.1 CRISPR system Cascade subunit CasA [Deinococcus soli (ex Cha et al. 2016)]MDR6753715.1 CRISPR system Cascade subunit CasA [Deinococcus soli (ex Cha et al. 2016)]
MNSPPTFNLLHEPWIPVRPLNGDPVREVGLRDLILDARTYSRIDDPSPLVTVALLRLTLALLHRALRGPTSTEQAAEWYTHGFPADTLAAYFQTWEDHFDLFHPEKPFWQVRDLTLDLEGGKYCSHWTRLGTEVGSANTLPLFNVAGRPGGERSDALTPAQAARRLAEGQTFLLGGLIKRFTTAAKAAPVATLALTAAQGHDLHETLCLNLPVYAGQDSDRAVWEREPLTVQSVRAFYEDELSEVPTGRADRYTWPSRSVLLIPDTDESGQVHVTSIGFAAGIPLEGTAEGSGSNIDPMVTLRPPGDPKKPERFPLKLKREQLLWRDLSALLAGPAAEQTGNHPPGTLTFAQKLLERAGRPCGLSLTVTGLLSDQGKAFAYRQEGYTFPHAFISDPEAFATEINRALSASKAVGQGLNSATLRLAAEVVSRGGERDPHKDDVRNLAQTLPGVGAYWAALEAPFRVFLAGLDSPEEASADWRASVTREARAAWAMNVQGAGGDGQVLGFAFRPRRTDGKYQPSPQGILDRALASLNAATRTNSTAPEVPS